MSLRDAFLNQAISCGALGSPFMERLFNILADHWPTDSALALRLSQYEGDIGPSGHSLPLRIAAGLHALALSGQSTLLRDVYPPQQTQDLQLQNAVLTAIETNADFLMDWTASPPQTNEVRRAATMIGAAHVAVTAFDLPIHLSELGASAGLNMMWDHYALEVAGQRFGSSLAALTFRPEWRGDLPPPASPQIASRAGIDLNPLEVTRADHQLRLMAYIWPDQTDRMAMTRTAMSVTDAPIDQGDAIEWLERRLLNAPSGHLHFIQHSVAWQYFSAAAQTKGRALIEAAGAKATPERPLAWFSMETDGDTKGSKGAALALRIWPGNISLALGRADFHGRWVDWHPKSSN